MSKTPDFKSNKTFIDLVREEKNPLPETGWNLVGPSEDHGVNFTSGWDNSSPSSVPASWYLTDDGSVRLRGKITGGDVGSTIFTLPEEVRPQFLERYIIPMEDDMHLENIKFRAFIGGTGIPDIATVPKLLATGFHGTYSSDDGVTWSLASTIQGNCCTYDSGHGVWVLGTDFSDFTPAHPIYTSNDGTTWTAQTTPWDGQVVVWSLAYSPTLDMLVATTNDNSVTEQIMTSTDGGVSWNVQSSYWDDWGGNIEDVSWFPSISKFVLVADAHYSSDPDFSHPLGVAYSSDGATWTTVMTPADPSISNKNSFMFGIGGGGGTLVACGNFSNTGGNAPYYSIMTSSDAITWTVATNSTDSNSYDCMVNSGLYVMGTNNTPTDSIETTTDFSSFSVVDNQLSYINAVVWSPNANMFVGVGEDSSSFPGIITSPDGSTWTEVSAIHGTLVDVWDIDASYA